jgi:hypothetical protein
MVLNGFSLESTMELSIESAKVEQLEGRSEVFGGYGGRDKTFC